MAELPRSLPEFEARFPDDAACARWLLAKRWPEGFRYGLEAIGTLGSPPPRIVISGPPDDRWAGRETVFGVPPASTGPSRRRA